MKESCDNCRHKDLSESIERCEQCHPNDAYFGNWEKQEIRFCWECGNKLWGNTHVKLTIHGLPRILHKTCAKENYSYEYDGLKKENKNDR